MNSQLRNDLNRFLYEERLQKEGMLRTQRQFADKTLVNILLGPLGSYSFSLRLMEVVLLKFLRHENLIPVTGLHFWHDNLKIQMTQARAAGLGQLSDVCLSPQLSPAHVKYIMFQTFSAVVYLHHNGVVARGLHPGNIWLNKQSEVCLSDLSSARLIGLENMNCPDHFVDLSFTSPEVSLNPKRNFTSSDVWSLGCILFQLVAKTAFISVQNSEDLLNDVFQRLGTPDDDIPLRFIQNRGTLEWVRGQPKRRAKLPSSYVPDSSAHLKDLLDRCLKFDPSERISALEALRHPYFAELCDWKELERGVTSDLHSINFEKIFDKHSSRSEKLQFVFGLLQT